MRSAISIWGSTDPPSLCTDNDAMTKDLPKRSSDSAKALLTGLLEGKQPLRPKDRMAISPQDMPVQDPQVRRQNFNEVALGYTPEQVLEEAKRCLNCRMCGNCIFERGQLCFETSTRLL